ncbi:hypothetical protein HAX54_010975, partial [Datura stramonium]|nr:hypothetical protein [Datura stramonium]
MVAEMNNNLKKMVAEMDGKDLVEYMKVKSKDVVELTKAAGPPWRRILCRSGTAAANDA